MRVGGHERAVERPPRVVRYGATSSIGEHVVQSCRVRHKWASTQNVCGFGVHQRGVWVWRARLHPTRRAVQAVGMQTASLCGRKLYTASCGRVSARVEPCKGERTNAAVSLSVTYRKSGCHLHEAMPRALRASCSDVVPVFRSPKLKTRGCVTSHTRAYACVRA